MLTNAPRGTKDILPDTVGDWLYIEKEIRDLCKRFGYQETEAFFEELGIMPLIEGKKVYPLSEQYLY